MKILALLTFLTIAYCQVNTQVSRQIPGSKAKYCTERERNKTRCEQVDESVVGYLQDGGHAVYINKCFACRDKNLDHYYDLDRCPIVYKMFGKPRSCFEDDAPVCGITTRGLKTQTSECVACSDENTLDMFYPGRCIEWTPAFYDLSDEIDDLISEEENPE